MARDGHGGACQCLLLPAGHHTPLPHSSVLVQAFLLPILGLAVLLPILVIMHVNPTRLILWAQFGYQ